MVVVDASMLIDSLLLDALLIDALLIDALLIDALLINGTARFRLASENLHAPDLIDAEVLSALRRLVLADRLEATHALQALTVLQQLGLRRHSSRGLWAGAWELRTNLSACDALDVALAEQLRVVLPSCDDRSARAPGLRCPGELLSP